LNTPLSRSSASLRFITSADHLRADFALGRTEARLALFFGCLVLVAIAAASSAKCCPKPPHEVCPHSLWCRVRKRLRLLRVEVHMPAT
jgi:hypothetical protein